MSQIELSSSPPRSVFVASGGQFESWSAEELVRWAVRRWAGHFGLVTSFQIEGMVLLDLAWRVDPKVRVLTIDTGRLHQETHEMIERVRERYGLSVEVFVPRTEEVEALVRGSGPNLFFRSFEERRRCCHVRKVQPLRRALQGLDAWMTGLRRDQTSSRAGTPKVDLDPASEWGRPLYKLSPLADWTEDEVHSYARDRRLPMHPLYSRGFTSIGCAPCTRVPLPGEDPRSGRWWWEGGDHKECGLHPLPAAAGMGTS